MWEGSRELMGGKQGQIQTENDRVQILSADVEESRPDPELKTLSPNFFWTQNWEEKWGPL